MSNQILCLLFIYMCIHTHMYTHICVCMCVYVHQMSSQILCPLYMCMCVYIYNIYAYMCLLCACMCMLSHFIHVQLFATPWTVACQAPISMEFSRQEYWSGLPCPPFSRGSSQPRDRTCISTSPALEAGFLTISATWEGIYTHIHTCVCIYTCACMLSCV